jgi:hypothetical protein
MDLIQKENAEETNLTISVISYSGHLQNFIQLQLLSCKSIMYDHDLG